MNVVFGGADEQSRRCRHAIARYVNATSVLCWRDISVKVRQRFPTMQHVVDAGLLTSVEYAMYSSVPVG
jgi:hypothetical protein